MADVVTCGTCWHQWHPRGPSSRPKRCPACGTRIEEWVEPPRRSGSGVVWWVLLAVAMPLALVALAVLGICCLGVVAR